MTFSLEPEQTGTLSLFPEKPALQYPEAYTDTKANRFALVLGSDNPGTDVIKSDISSGQQDRWEQIVKTRADVQNSQRRNDLIREISTEATQGGQVRPTVDTTALVTSLSDDQLYASDLGTVLSEQYSRVFTNYVSESPENKVFAEAMDENPDATLEVLDRSEFANQRALLAQDKLEQVNRRYEESGNLEVGLAWLKQAIPGYSWWKTADRIESAPTVSTLSGANLGEQIAYLYQLPPKEFKETLDKAVDELADDNILMARDFANAVISYSGSEEYFRTLFDVLDVADIGTLGLTATGRLAVGATRAGRAILNNPQDVAKAAADIGAHKAAAVSRVVENTMAGDVSGLSLPTAAARIEERLPSIFAPGRAFTGKSSLEAAAGNRLQEAISRSARHVQEFMSKGQLIDRLEPSQLAQAATEAFEEVKDIFTNVNHNIIDMAVIPAQADRVTNLNQVAVRFGERDGTMFASEKRAQNFAKKYIGLKTNDFEIRQEGVGGFFIEVRRNVAENGDFRTLKIESDLKTPNSLSATYLSSLKSADYKLPKQNVQARGRVVHGQEFLAEYMKNITAPFSGKGKDWVSEMDNVFRKNRVDRKYFDTVEEFEVAFKKLNGKLPDEDQAAAYFTYVQLNDLDYLIRDADIVKQKARLGGEAISFKDVDSKGQPFQRQFDGKVVDNLPYGSKSNYSVVVMENGKPTKRKSSRFINDKDKAQYADRISNGYKVVLDPSDSTYYIVKDFKRDRIKLGGLNRLEGGHNEYRYDHFIKQGDLDVTPENVARYKGDKSLFSAETSRQAQEIAEQFDRARVMYRDKDPGARKFIEDNLPVTYAEFAKKVAKGDIRLDVPIVATRKGQRTSDVYRYGDQFEFFDDVSTSDHNVFASVGGRYTGGRSETVLDVLRSENGQIFRSDNEALLDPLETLASTSANMLDVRLVNDYKFKSVADWAQEFAGLMDVPLNKVMSNPLHYLQHPVYRTGANPEQIKIAENVRQAVLSLNNYKDPTTLSIENFRDRMIESVYGTKFEGLARAIPDINDVTTFTRRIAFDFKLGLFNPKQLFLQGSQAANVIAITPKAGALAARASIFTRMALRTESPEVLNGLANRWSKFMGWEKQDWLDMVESFKQSGFSIVSNDVAYLDDFRPKTFSKGGKFSKAYEHHTAFFKEGELISRNMAYAAAWREFKDRNPGKVIDRFAETRILQRAKDLTTNMTRDSNAPWQKGLLSVSTQFMGYQARFMEQLWDGGLLKDGSKLTRAEKGRLIAAMSMMYGAPVAASGAVGFLPVKDMLRDWLAQEGVGYDDTVMEPFLDGLVPTIAEAMTGSDMDWSATYGPNGITTLYDLFNEDKSWTDVLMGASGGVIADTLAASVPAVKGVADMANPNSDSTWPVLIQDLIEPLKNISSVNTALRAYEGMNTHRYLSKNGNYLTDVSTMDVVQSAIFGVNPDRVSEAYSQIAALKATKASIQAYQKELQQWTEKGIEAARRGDEESAAQYFSRAHSVAIRGGLTLTEQNQARRSALDAQALDESVFETYQKRVLNRKQNADAVRTNTGE